MRDINIIAQIALKVSNFNCVFCSTADVFLFGYYTFPPYLICILHFYNLRPVMVSLCYCT